MSLPGDRGNYTEGRRYAGLISTGSNTSNDQKRRGRTASVSMFLSLFAVSGGLHQTADKAKIKNMRRFCTASSLGSRGLVYWAVICVTSTISTSGHWMNAGFLFFMK